MRRTFIAVWFAVAGALLSASALATPQTTRLRALPGAFERLRAAPRPVEVARGQSRIWGSLRVFCRGAVPSCRVRVADGKAITVRSTRLVKRKRGSLIILDVVAGSRRGEFRIEG